MNTSVFSYDNLFVARAWFNYLNINSYPVLGVVWNLALLLVPFYLAKKLDKDFQADGFKNRRDQAMGVIIFLIWLIFIPNAAYIITDIRHLANECATNSYFKVCLETAWFIPVFFIYALIGWIFFVFLLRQMKKIIIKIFNERVGEFFIWLVIPWISLGVLLGLLHRWNSWEVVISPLLIIKNALIYFTDISYFINWVVFTITLYILYQISDLVFKK